MCKSVSIFGKARGKKVREGLHFFVAEVTCFKLVESFADVDRSGEGYFAAVGRDIVAPLFSFVLERSVAGLTFGGAVKASAFFKGRKPRMGP